MLLKTERLAIWRRLLATAEEHLAANKAMRASDYHDTEAAVGMKARLVAFSEASVRMCQEWIAYWEGRPDAA